MKRSGFVVAALALALTAGCNKGTTARNDTNNGAAVGTAGRDGGLSNSDRDFIRDIATMNAAELELGRLASERASTPEVKRFAQMMVTDHTSAGDKVQAFVAQHPIDIPTQLDDNHRDLRDKLAAKTGLDFDKEFADKMVDEHQKLADKLESRIDKDTITRAHVDNKGAPDADVKATAVMPEKSDNPNTQAVNQIAADLYPSVYAHLQAAKALKDGVSKRSTN
jgi:predicted outer membrane protein